MRFTLLVNLVNTTPAGKCLFGDITVQSCYEATNIPIANLIGFTESAVYSAQMHKNLNTMGFTINHVLHTKIMPYSVPEINYFPIPWIRDTFNGQCLVPMINLYSSLASDLGAFEYMFDNQETITLNFENTVVCYDRFFKVKYYISQLVKINKLECFQLKSLRYCLDSDQALKDYYKSLVYFYPVCTSKRYSYFNSTQKLCEIGARIEHSELRVMTNSSKLSFHVQKKIETLIKYSINSCLGSPKSYSKTRHNLEVEFIFPKYISECKSTVTTQTLSKEASDASKDASSEQSLKMSNLTVYGTTKDSTSEASTESAQEILKTIRINRKPELDLKVLLPSQKTWPFLEKFIKPSAQDEQNVKNAPDKPSPKRPLVKREPCIDHKKAKKSYGLRSSRIDDTYVNADSLNLVLNENQPCYSFSTDKDSKSTIKNPAAGQTSDFQETGMPTLGQQMAIQDFPLNNHPTDNSCVLNWNSILNKTEEDGIGEIGYTTNMDEDGLQTPKPGFSGTVFTKQESAHVANQCYLPPKTTTGGICPNPIENEQELHIITANQNQMLSTMVPVGQNNSPATQWGLPDNKNSISEYHMLLLNSNPYTGMSTGSTSMNSDLSTAQQTDYVGTFDRLVNDVQSTEYPNSMNSRPVLLSGSNLHPPNN